MEIKNNGALQFLREQAQAQAQAKATKEKEKTIKQFLPNEYGFYTMQQIYIIDKMCRNGAIIESNGIMTYKTKSGEQKQYKIADITCYNMCIEYYEQLRNLGIKNCIELIKWDDNTIELIRKINGDYYTTTITSSGIIDNRYNGAKTLLTFAKIDIK